MAKFKTMFKLVTADGGILNTVAFDKFGKSSDDLEKRRAMAKEHIQHMKERWEAQAMFAGKTLRIVEE